MRKFIIAALLAGTIAAPAMAQTGAPFTGPRVEGIVGYDRAGSENVKDSDGVNYGAGVGYDFQMGNMVAGVEGEIGDSTIDKCSTAVVVAGDQLCAKVGRDLYAGGRIGSVVGRNTLVYAKAGYTNARLETAYEDGLATTAGDFTTSGKLDGVRLGAGVEHAVGPNSFVKAEYRYSNYEQGFEKHQGVVGFGFRF